MASLGDMKNHPVKSSPVVAGATSVAALFAASSLDASIVYSVPEGWAGATVGDGEDTSFAWNIDGDGSAEMTWATYSSDDAWIFMKSFANAFAFRTDGVDSKLQNLGYNADVLTDSDSSFLNSPLSSVLLNGEIKYANGFTSGESGYIGFKFTPDATKLYGWAEVILTNGSPAGSFEIVRWAYEGTGANIKTGQVPEPAGAATGLGLLALGAAGVRRMRRPQAA